MLKPRMLRGLFLAAGATLLLTASAVPAHAETKTFPLDSIEGLKPHGVEIAVTTYKGRKALQVTAPIPQRRPGGARAKKGGKKGGPPGERGSGEKTMVVVGGADFHDGVIEVDLVGRPRQGALGGARGFVGVAFRVAGDVSKFECFYLRPTNGRAEDQERRNHASQYISAPDYPWFRLRSETPSKYEAYVDLQPGEWIKVKIEVRGDTARLYVHGNEQPTIVVNDLKLGADVRGAVALWAGVSTEAYFSNLRITQ